MNYNLIQVNQLNRPDLSGYILEVVSPYTGSVQYSASGADGQVLFKSGIYSIGSSLFFTSGKFGFGITNPAYDFDLQGKSIAAGTGYFEDLFINSNRVATSYEVGISGAFLLAAVNALTDYVNTGFLSSGQINSLYYPRTNPSGYLTSQQTGNFITNDQTGAFATTGWVDSLYYPRSNPSGFGGGGGGLQNLSFDSGTSLLSITSGNSVSLGVYLKTGDADARYALIGGTGNFVTNGQTGNFLTTGQTGEFYPRNNPSGYVRSSQTGNFITSQQTGQFQPVGSYVLSSQTGDFYSRSNPSGYVRAIETGVFITSAQTGQFQPIGSYVNTSQTGEFATTGWVNEFYYPRSNPSGYGLGGGGGIQNLSFDSGTKILGITSGNSVSLGVFLNTGEADSRYLLKSETGSFVTNQQTGIFYPHSNPSGFITGIDSGSFVTNIQTGSFATTGWVDGGYYPRSNPSGFITSVSATLQSLSFDSGTSNLSITSGNTVSLGIYLKSGDGDSRYALQSNTGNFVTTGQTGNYYPRSNPSGYISTWAETGVTSLSGLHGDVTVVGAGAVSLFINGQILTISGAFSGVASSGVSDLSPLEAYSFFVF